jgi:uncharacterized protein (TIGR04255 family)
MFSSQERCQYRHNQLADVICQLRFPEILTIDANPPVDFQEEIRVAFPIYSSRIETPAPKLRGTPGNLHVEKHASINNYQFASTDGCWRVNLTSGFISLTCNRYTNWETFAKMLDAPLAAFIRLYKPILFERIGLRYLNFISRQELNLENTPFRELFQPCYLGLLSEDDVIEQSASRSSVDAEISIQGGCKAKIHAGPGIVKKNGQTEKEVKFIFDQDLYMTGNIPVNYSAGALETLHRQAFPIFRGAITDLLHNAMEPI